MKPDLERIRHMKAILEMLLGKEDLYYLEYAAKANVSAGYASHLCHILSYRFNIPYKYGMLENPGDDKIKQALAKIEEELNQRIMIIQSREAEQHKTSKRLKTKPRRRGPKR